MTTSRSVSAPLRTFVLDTSVLLSDPWAVIRFAEHNVVLPLIVISELEGKRHHHELGWFARESLRMLDDLRVEFGRLDQPVPIGTSGGTLQVELNHTDPTVLPVGFRTDSNDSRILACALNLAARRSRHAVQRRRHRPRRGARPAVSHRSSTACRTAECAGARHARQADPTRAR